MSQSAVHGVLGLQPYSVAGVVVILYSWNLGGEKKKGMSLCLHRVLCVGIGGLHSVGCTVTYHVCAR